MLLEMALDSKALDAAVGRMRGPEVGKAVKASLERRANDARRAAVRAFVSRGIGKGIFGRKDSGAWKIITLSETRVSGDTVSLTLKATGLAAMQETGGQIRPHVIKPKRASILAFAVTGGFGFGGDLVFTKVVNHPGGPVHKHPALVPEAEKIIPQAVDEIRERLTKLWNAAA